MGLVKQTGGCFIRRFWLFLFSWLVAGVAQGTSPVPPELRERVWFWERVFSEYTESITILHDREHPEFILDVLDFQSARIQRLFPSSTREQIISFYMQRY